MSRARHALRIVRRATLVVLVLIGLVLDAGSARARACPGLEAPACDCPCSRARAAQAAPGRAQVDRPDCCEAPPAAESTPLAIHEPPGFGPGLDTVPVELAVPRPSGHRTGRTDRRVRGPPRVPAYLAHCSLLL
ncbi:MAG: hypothetical protein KDK70_39820 [Myxococcales bacterium]|nr:hypothetical protein [Myxococcales bacterium]